MLLPAIAKKEELTKKWLSIIYNPVYKYGLFADGSCQLTPYISDNTWSDETFVSVDKESDDIYGYFQIVYGRPSNNVTNLLIINFDMYDPTTTFFNSLKELFEHIFITRKTPNVFFYVVVGNPAEDQYDRFVRLYNGSIVGTFKDYYWIDGEYYDKKCYQISREQFMTRYDKYNLKG